MYDELVDTARVWIDEENEELKTVVNSHYASEVVVENTYTFVAHHKFGGREPQSKVVSNFGHEHTASTAIAWGAETVRATNDTLWSCFGKNGVSTEVSENGVAADKATTGYDYYIERPVFKKGNIVVDFGYAPVKVDLLQSSVTAVDSDKDGYKKAILKDFIGTTYLGGNQNLYGEVNLYRSNTDVKDEILKNGKIYVIADSVCADIDHVTILENGKEIAKHEHWSQPWTIRNTTDWSSIQEILSQITDKEVVVTLSGSVARNKGNWYWNELTNNLSDYAHLYDGQAMLNGREVVFANNLVYKTESGKVFTFEVLPYSVKEVGAALNMREKDLYDYSEVIEENLGGYTRSNTAHGTLKISEEKIQKIEGRNLVQTVYDNRVHNEFDLVYVYASHEDVTHKTHDFPCTDEVKSNWTVTANDSSEKTGQPMATLTGSEPTTDGNWSCDMQQYSTKANVTLNGATAQNELVSTRPNHVKYTENGFVISFEELKFAAAYVNSNATLLNTEGLNQTYKYENVISLSYGNNMKSLTAPGTIKVTQEDKLLKKEARNKVQSVSNGSVHNEFDRVYVYTTREEVTHMTHDFSRTNACTSDWLANEKNANERTAQPTVMLAGSQPTTDGAWSCDMQSRNMTAVVTLNGSTQYNEWTLTDPNHIKYEEEGLTVEFDELKFNAAYVNSSAVLSKTEGLTQTYKYDNSVSISYGNNMQTVSAPGTIVVNEDDVVVDHDMRDKRYIITNSEVKAVGKYISIHKSGKEDVEEVSKSAPRTSKIYPAWHVSDVNASVLTNSAVVKLLSSNTESDGNWSWNAEKRANTTLAQLQSSNQTNGVETVDPNFFKYERDGKVYEWGEISFSAEEKGHDVSVASNTATMTTYDYKDNVEIVYGDNHQTFELSGIIDVAKEKTITNRYLTDASQTIDQNGVTNSIVKVTEWSDGTVDRESFSKFFGRNFRRISDWASEEDNANQSTGSAQVTLISSDAKSDGNWSWNDNKRGITTEASLNASTQINEWESIDPDNFVFEDGDLRHEFAPINFSVTETGATVNKKSENTEVTVYDYTDNISVNYGNNSFSSSAPGKITVKAPWDPDFDHGRFTSCVITTARNEQRNTWVYVASVGFETGHMPLIIRQGASAPEVNEAYFEANTDSRLNSGTWVPSWGKWINTIATDTPDLMQWSTTEGANADNMAYPTATAWGWDYGYTVSGHPTVTTDKFSAKISQDGYVLTIYSGNNVFATYKAAKR